MYPFDEEATLCDVIPYKNIIFTKIFSSFRSGALCSIFYSFFKFNFSIYFETSVISSFLKILGTFSFFNDYLPAV
jgi:hypothetical protein